MSVEYILQVYSYGYWKTIQRTVSPAKTLALFDNVRDRFGTRARILKSAYLAGNDERNWEPLEAQHLQTLRGEVAELPPYVDEAEEQMAAARESEPQRKSRLR